MEKWARLHSHRIGRKRTKVPRAISLFSFVKEREAETQITPYKNMRGWTLHCAQCTRSSYTSDSPAMRKNVRIMNKGDEILQGQTDSTGIKSERRGRRGPCTMGRRLTG